MIGQLRLSHVIAGFVAVVVGYTGSIAIVFQAAEVVAATSGQINSWFLALGFGLGLTSLGLSWWYKTPVLTAWSTPGAAFLVGALAGFDISEAIGAFIISGVLITLTGVSGLLERMTKFIHRDIASALLAGILLQFCVDAFSQLEREPMLVGSMLLVFLISLKFSPRYAVLLALLVGVLMSINMGLIQTGNVQLSFAQPVWISPTFTLDAIVGIAIPLYFICRSSDLS
ncbi:MAG: benzoate/H(+) symporter BenE family transporter [Gammaproteobacteria bacterium]|nr:benzoate/H(+) symporter BenE family transporter [Gammaproteobacteria bacterium]